MLFLSRSVSHGHFFAITFSRRFSGEVAEKAVGNQAVKYAKKRGEIEKEVSLLRKQWAEDHRIKEERLRLQREAERKRIVIEKAIRLREFRKRKEINMARDAARKKQEMEDFRAELARRHAIAANVEQAQNQRFESLIKDLKEESAAWLTMANMKEKITEDLFERPTTTGLITANSEHWRWEVTTLNLRRNLSEENVSQKKPSSLSDRLEVKAQSISQRIFVVEDFLTQMIGTGLERSKFKQIVAKYLKAYEETDGGFEDYDMYTNGELIDLGFEEDEDFRAIYENSDYDDDDDDGYKDHDENVEEKQPEINLDSSGTMDRAALRKLLESTETVDILEVKAPNKQNPRIKNNKPKGKGGKK